MALTSLNISLPKGLKTYIEEQVKAGDWSTPTEYVRDLIRKDKERHMAAQMEKNSAGKPAKRRRRLGERMRSGLQVYEEMLARNQAEKEKIRE